MSDISQTEDAPPGSDLCAWCARFDFAGWFQIGRAKRDPERSEIKIRHLGHLHKLRRKKNCAFCRMVVHIADLHFAQDLGPHVAISLPDDHRVMVTPIIVREIQAKRKPQQIRRLQVRFYEGVESVSPYQIQMLDESVTADQLDQWKDDQHKRGVVTNVEDLKIWDKFEGALGMNGGLLASENLDISLVARWLDHCIKNHEATCSMLRPDRGDRETRTMIKGDFRLGDDLRVIDVQAMKLCSAPKGLSFCALSYLWGGVSMLKTEKRNVERLSQDNGILEEGLPLTIRDAIQFCRKIGWRYLWVDALCIIQDDKVDVASQISQMQSIYRFADFTIVAASGVDSNAGLPDIQSPRRVSQHMEKIQGLRLVTTLPPFEHIQETSRWSTRAWTFQESKLSRLIFFSKGQMHFRCEGGEYCEDTRAEETNLIGPGWHYGSFSSTSLLLGAPHGRGFDIFQDLVAQYSQKVLTYPHDVLNGFSGIINALKPFGTIDQYWISGLPVKGRRLVESLLWIPTYKHASELRRLNLLQTDFVRRPGNYVAIDYRNKRVEDGVEHKFPSWSWIGWVGDIDYLDTPPATIKQDCKPLSTTTFSPSTPESSPSMSAILIEESHRLLSTSTPSRIQTATSSPTSSFALVSLREMRLKASKFSYWSLWRVIGLTHLFVHGSVNRFQGMWEWGK